MKQQSTDSGQTVVIRVSAYKFKDKSLKREIIEKQKKRKSKKPRPQLTKAENRKAIINTKENYRLCNAEALIKDT